MYAKRHFTIIITQFITLLKKKIEKHVISQVCIASRLHLEIFPIKRTHLLFAITLGYVV